MNTPFEIRKLYKEETGEIPWEWSFFAEINDEGNIVIGGDEDANLLKKDILRNGSFDLPDMNYVKWLEEKVMLMINK